MLNLIHLITFLNVFKLYLVFYIEVRYLKKIKHRKSLQKYSLFVSFHVVILKVMKLTFFDKTAGSLLIFFMYM